MKCDFSILIVDDSVENIYSFKLLIEDNFENIKIYESTNVKDAILCLMENEIDLILSDIRMPELDGFEFVKFLQTIDELAHIPVILISGINKDEYKKKAYLFPEVVDFISKPIDDEILSAKLKVFINIFEERKIDKKKLMEKESLIRSEKNKIDSMINELSKCSFQLSEKVKKDDRFIELMQEDENQIDLEDIIKSRKGQ